MKRLLLLGGHGFIGSQVRARLELHPEFAVSVAPPSSILDLTTASDAAWDALILDNQPDVIVNCAGRTTGNAEQLLEANALLPARLLQVLTRLGRTPWLVHLGSGAEYGSSKHGTALSERAHPHPLSTYGLSKLAGTQLLDLAFASGQAQGSVLRVFNPLGAGQSEATLPGRAAAGLRAARLERRTQLTFGPLGSVRDYLDVRDVARAVVLVAGLNSAPTLLNVGSGRPTRSRDLVEALADIAGYRGVLAETAPGSSRSEAVPWQQANIRRMRALGWEPCYSQADALRELWRGSAPAHLRPLEGPLTSGTPVSSSILQTAAAYPTVSPRTPKERTALKEQPAS
ncbi:NAD-dependent epimerase/dehydratase family protein [Deinococcus ruber]|uniref:Reductase n=1 Tax=Deinococcus ruber TaxID=1848197 RepID=A0A918BZJ6_9DEIO|nr:NAD(P)-dependent oxidoreductase [Deinococcus ruber]GGQ99387.1 reductase [Deinococcus ruber]